MPPRVVIGRRQEVEAAGHPLREVGGVEGPDPGGGQLEGEWQPVQLPADADDAC